MPSPRLPLVQTLVYIYYQPSPHSQTQQPSKQFIPSSSLTQQPNSCPQLSSQLTCPIAHFQPITILSNYPTLKALQTPFCWFFKTPALFGLCRWRYRHRKQSYYDWHSDKVSGQKICFKKFSCNIFLEFEFIILNLELSSIKPNMLMTYCINFNSTI